MKNVKNEMRRFILYLILLVFILDRYSQKPDTKKDAPPEYLRELFEKA